MKPAKTDPRGVKILAKSVYKSLRTDGFDTAEIVDFASTLLDLLTPNHDNPEKNGK